MDSGEVAAIVSLISMALTYFGIQLDPGVVSGAVTGFIALVAFASGIYSWYSHSAKNAAAAAQQ